VVAAALTALGAGNGPHSLVTIFGAIDTVIAGLMTYLKGSGFPDRLKYHQTQWTGIREYIEQRERELCKENCTLDVEAEVLEIERMYEEIKEDVEMSTSETVVGLGKKKDIRNNQQRTKTLRGINDQTKGLKVEGKPEHCQCFPHCKCSEKDHGPHRLTYLGKGTGPKSQITPLTGKEKEVDVSHMV